MKTTLLCARALLVAALLVPVACGSNSPTSPTTVTSPTTIAWTNLVSPGGAATRSFITSQPGNVAVTLQAAPVPLGVGLGVAPESGKGCLPAVSWTLAPGESAPSTPVAEGTYCLLVYEVGTTIDQIQFTVNLEYP